MPAHGGPAIPLSINEVIKVAQKEAHVDASVDFLRSAMASIVKKAEFREHMENPPLIPLALGQRIGQSSEMEKQALISSLILGGKRLLGAAGRVWRGPAAAKAGSKAMSSTGVVKALKPKGKDIPARMPVKPKSLTRQLLPGALLLGTGYGAMKGIPAAVNWASRAKDYPLAYNFGQRQYQYGYTPDGQAQF